MRDVSPCCREGWTGPLAWDHCASQYILSIGLNIWEGGRKVRRERGRKEEVGGREEKGGRGKHCDCKHSQLKSNLYDYV